MIFSMQEKYNMYKEGNIKFLRFSPDEKASWNETTFSRLNLNRKYLHVYFSYYS